MKTAWRVAAGDALVQLAASAVRVRVIDEAVRVAELALVEEREPVDLAVGPLARLQDVQVVAREPRADRDRYRLVGGVALEAHHARGDVERGRALLLPTDMADVRIRADGDLGDALTQ